MSGRRHPTRDTRPVIVNRAIGATAKNALVTEVSLLIIETHHRHFIRKLLPITTVVASKEIILDPEDLVDGAHEGDLATEREVRV